MGDSTSFYVENKHTFMILAKLRKDVSLMDIAFTFKDKLEIYAHKAIVCQYSPLLAAKCASNKGLVKINFEQLNEEIETKPAHLNYLLDFMYFQNVTIRASDMQSTIKLAVYLNIVEFLSAANQQIKPLSLEKMITNIKEEPHADPVSIEQYEDPAEPVESDNDFFPLDTDPLSPESDPLSSTSGMVTSQSGMQLPLNTPAEINGEVFETKLEPADGTEEYQSLLEVKKPESLLKKSVTKKITIKKISMKRPTPTSKRKRTTKVPAGIPVEDDDDSATDDYDDTYDDDPNDQDYTVDGDDVNNGEEQEYLADDIKSEDEDAPKQKKRKSSPSKTKKQIPKKKPMVPNMTKIDELGVRKCVECNEVFDTWPEVGQHRVDVHKRHACLICSKSFPDEPALIRHNVLHTEGIEVINKDGDIVFKCDVCSEEFELRLTYNEHILQHREYPFVCARCGKLCINQYQFCLHILNHEGMKLFKCQHCEKGFDKMWMKIEHENVEHGENHELPPMKDGEYKREKVKPSLISAFSPGHVLCDICGKSFKYSRYMVEHRRNMHGERDVPCPKCDLKFTTQMTLKHHMLKHEDAAANYACEICGLTFKRKQNLNEHTRRHATHKCGGCEEEFQHAKYLLQHLSENASCSEKHDKTYPKCAICNRLFTTSSTLRVHMKKMHNPGDTEMFTCEQCGKEFVLNCDLRRHLRKHEDYKNKKYQCPTCDKCFLSSVNLSEHMNIHTGAKPHHCDQCDARFTGSSALYKHVNKVHKGIGNQEAEKDQEEEKFICEVCVIEFKKVKHLLVHLSNNKMCKFSYKKTFPECPVCEKLCYKAHLLDLHVRTQHTPADAPFACNLCDKRFVIEKDMLRHVQHHKSLANRDFQCRKCGKSFGSLSGLLVHEKKATKLCKPPKVLSLY